MADKLGGQLTIKAPKAKQPAVAFDGPVEQQIVEILTAEVNPGLAAHGGDEAAVTEFTGRMKPLSIIGLLLTVLLLFGFQAETIVAQPLLIALIAAPIIVQSYGIFLIAYGWAKAWKVPHAVAAPCALIGTSNFFELAVAVAISLFGLNSGASLATVVGVLVEVPVMFSLVAFANRTKHWFNRA